MPRCKVCNEPTTSKFGLTALCSVDHALEYAQRKSSKKRQAAQRKAEREEKQKHRQDKEKVRTRGDLMKKAQSAFNAYIRARAIRFGHCCISSGRPLIEDKIGGGFDCGHYRSIGSAPHLRFNINNAWGQSKHDNQYKSGNMQNYRDGLIKMIGIEKVEALENNNEYRKFDCNYLLRIAKIFRRKKRNIERWAKLSKA